MGVASEITASILAGALSFTMRKFPIVEFMLPPLFPVSERRAEAPFVQSPSLPFIRENEVTTWELIYLMLNMKGK